MNNKMKIAIPIAVLLVAIALLIVFLLAPKPHTHEFGKWEKVVEPSCIQTGLWERKCECGEVEHEAIRNGDHVEGEWVEYEDRKELLCHICSEIIEVKELEIHTHSFGEWKVVTNATCEVKGLKKSYCECGEEKSEEIPLAEHTKGVWIAIENTYELHCKICDEIMDVKVIGTVTTPTKPPSSTTKPPSQNSTSSNTPTQDSEPDITNPHNFEIKNGILEDGTSCDDEQVIIPMGVIEIGNKAFRENEYIQSVFISNSVEIIRRGAFLDCKQLKSITIPSNLLSIETMAFQKCINLTSIVFEGTMAQWNTIDKGENWDLNTGNYIVYCTDGTIPK